MPITIDAAGVPWLDPRHVNLNTIVADLDTMPIPQVTTTHAITPAEWREIAAELPALYGAASPARNDVLNAVVNMALGPYALCVPSFATRPELNQINTLVTAPTVNTAALHRAVGDIVMQPRLRALQLVGRFMKLQPFDEFAYLVDSAAISFYRGNIPAAFMTVIPVIEGVLLRWQGYPGVLAAKPKFSDTLTFVTNTTTRQLYPLMPLFFDSWAAAAAGIIRDHLYRNTNAGPAVDYFNRHLALHLLEDQTFGTRENITRAFLLLDILSDLYICENHITDPRFGTKYDEEAGHFAAYKSALASQDSSDQPEKILAKTHAKCK
jgi:hypothetical protein